MMGMRPRRAGHAGWGAWLLAAGLVLPCGAQAGVRLFEEQCMAHAGDLRRLPNAMARTDMSEIDPGQGPRGPAAVPDGARRRLWARVGGTGHDAYTGLAVTDGVAVCWHVSRPGETPAAALAALKRRFPPVPPGPERGTEAFYGGSERWPARVNGTSVVVGVSWAFGGMPGQGTGFLFLAVPLRPSGAARVPTPAATG